MSKRQTQIGFKVDEDYEGLLQRALAITGKDRATFAREAVRAAMVRVIDGPEATKDTPVPRLELKDAASMIRWLEDTLVQFQQVAGEHQRQSAELRILERDDAKAMHRARAEFLEGYPERIVKSQKPIHDRLAELSGKMDELPGIVDIRAILMRIETAIGAALLDIATAARMDRAAAVVEARVTRDLIEAAMAAPRTVNRVELGDRSASQLGVLGLVVWLVSVGVLYALIMLLPSNWLAVRTANHLLGGGQQAICQLVNYRESIDTCRYQVGRKGSLVSIGVEQGARR